VHDFIVETFEAEGVKFARQHIDRTFPHENAETRKPGTGMLKEYFDQQLYDLAGSFVIGDRPNDVKLAENLGAKAIWLKANDLGSDEGLQFQEDSIALETTSWKKVYEFLKYNSRRGSLVRN